MLKKLFTSLAPLLAVAAFGVMPVAAHAEEPGPLPPWARNGANLAPAKPVQTMSWGTLTVSSPVGVFICKKADAGHVENLEIGAGGVDDTVLFDLYECVQPTGQCKTVPGVVEVRGSATGLPWPSVLHEPNLNEFRDWTTIGSGPPKPTGIKFDCYVSGSFSGEIVFYGTVKPKIKNGTSAGKAKLR